jgi:hypothetical protein
MSVRFSHILAPLTLGAALAVSTVLPAGAQEVRKFTVWNKTDIPFTQLFVSPTTTSEWGDDYLGSQVLNPGDGWNMTFDKYRGGQCLYDVKVTGKEGQEGKLIGVDLCKLDTITFSPVAASPKDLLEKWLANTAELGKLGIDPSNSTADYTTNPEGNATVLELRPKDTSVKSGINISISQWNSAETARAAIAQVADEKKAQGWQVDTGSPQGLGDRGFLTGASVSAEQSTLFFVVQIHDRLAVVSVTGGPDSKDSIVQAGGNLLVDLLKTVDPTFKG